MVIFVDLTFYFKIKIEKRTELTDNSIYKLKNFAYFFKIKIIRYY